MWQLRRGCTGGSGGDYIAPTGGSLLLAGETDGMGADFTVSSGAGDVSVKDVSTPGNVVTNVTGDSWWSNAGTSPKLVRNSGGTLQWSPHNLIVQSENFGTTWANANSTENLNATTDPLGGSTADGLVEDATSGLHGWTSGSFTVISGQTYTTQLYVKAGTRSWVQIVLTAVDGGSYFNLSGSGATGTLSGNGISASITSVGGGWYKCVLVSLSGATSGAVQVWAATGDGGRSYSGVAAAEALYVWGAQVNTGTTSTTYLATTAAAKYGLGIDYDGTSYGLLVEPAATNLALRSQEFDNAAWTATQITVTANNTTAPNGETTADLFTESASSAIQQVITTSAIAVSTSTIYTVSAYVKLPVSSTLQWVALEATDNGSGAGVDAYFDMVNHVVGSGVTFGSGWTAGALSIISIGSGWYRIACVVTTAASSSIKINIATALADGGSFNHQGSTGRTLYVWGAQLELGTVATSPIPTFAATVTRAADWVRRSAVAPFPISATENSLFFEVTPLLLAASGSTMLELSASTRDNGTTQIDRLGRYADYSVGFGTESQISLGITANLRHKYGGRSKANDFAACLNGGAVSTDVSGTYEATAVHAQISLGNSNDGNEPANVRIYKIVVVPRAWDNATLQAKTT